MRCCCPRLWPARGRRALVLLAVVLALAPPWLTPARATDLPEYRLKAAFIFNFIVYTEWPPGTAGNLALCIQGADPFGADADGLNGKTAAGRTLSVLRKAAGEPLGDCDVAYIAPSAMAQLPRTLDQLRRRPVLTLADSSGAMRQGVMLNMTMADGKVSFEANLQAARSVGLNLSSKLLRLATEVQQ